MSRENRKRQRKARRAAERDEAEAQLDREAELERKLAEAQETIDRLLVSAASIATEVPRLREEVQEWQARAEAARERARHAEEKRDLEAAARESIFQDFSSQQLRLNHVLEMNERLHARVADDRKTIEELRNQVRVLEIRARAAAHTSSGGFRIDDKNYKLLAALIHPDVHPEARKERATRAMQFLNNAR